jgi:hypothetical protein
MHRVLQSELSVQIDDLFKKAWEEDDVAEYEGDGMYHMHFRVLDGLIF